MSKKADNDTSSLEHEIDVVDVLPSNKVYQRR
jgi:hypothetical protein